MSPRLKRIALVIVAAAASGGLTVLRGQYGWLTDSVRIGLTCVLVIVVVIAQVVGQAAGRRSAMKRLLCHIHARAWGKDGGRDPEYRVSFFAPTLTGRGLRCYFRTDGNRPRRSWPKKPTAKKCQGLVGHVWFNGLKKDVPALPSVYSDEQLQDYLRETQVDAATFAKLSWKGAAMLAFAVVTSTGADPIGVLLVESKIPGQAIQSSTFVHDGALCGMVWEGFL